MLLVLPIDISLPGRGRIPGDAAVAVAGGHGIDIAILVHFRDRTARVRDVPARAAVGARHAERIRAVVDAAFAGTARYAAVGYRTRAPMYDISVLPTSVFVAEPPLRLQSPSSPVSVTLSDDVVVAVVDSETMPESPSAKLSGPPRLLELVWKKPFL